MLAFRPRTAATELAEREDWNKPGRLEDFLPAFEKWRFDWLDVPELCRAAARAQRAMGGSGAQEGSALGGARAARRAGRSWAEQRRGARMRVRAGGLKTLLRGRPLHSSERYQPIFIVGCNRSGTTLLRAILEAHPALHIPPETYVLGRVIREYQRYSRLPWSVLLKVILAEFDYHPEFHTFEVSLRELYAELLAVESERRNLARLLHGFYMFHARAAKPAARRWGDKTPVNTLALESIRQVFPDLRVLHIVRDGRDVAQSLLAMKRLETLEQAADRWKTFVAAAQRFGAAHGEQYLELRYEDLVALPRAEIQKLCDFVGVGFAEQMTRHQDLPLPLHDVDVYPHFRNVRKPIGTDSVGKWRRFFTPADRERLESLLSPMLEQLGYRGPG